MSELKAVEPTEVLVPLDEEEAKRLDKRLRLMAGTARDNFEKVGRLLDEARNGRIHEALGFKSWTTYVADALGGTLQLSGEARQVMVQMMAGEGMSLRAIASATGVSKSTVDRDLAEVSRNGTPANEKAPDSGFPQRDTSATGQSADAIVVTGVDGKNYVRPKRRPRKKPAPAPTPAPATVAARKPIPTVYRQAVRSLSPVIAELGSLADDPRWVKARDRFSEKDRVTLDGNIAVLRELRAAMDAAAPVTEADTSEVAI